MNSLWKWSIASICVLAVVISIASIWIVAKPPPPNWSDVTRHSGPAIVTAGREGVAIGPPSPPPSSTAPHHVILLDEVAPPTHPPPPNFAATQTAAETAAPSSPSVATAGQIEVRGKALQALPKGNIVLHAPNAMRVGERRTVEANVGVNVPIETLRKPPSSRDQTIEGSLRVSSEMVATLNGPGFKIDAVTPEKQTIAEGFPTVWSWNVEAKQDGDQELEATLYAIVGDDRQRIDSYVQKITVSVREQTWSEWLESLGHEIDAVKAILGALVAAATVVFGWFGISFARQKRKEAAKPVRKRKSPAATPAPPQSMS